MRKGEEDDVGATQGVGIGRHEDSVRESGQLRVHLPEPTPRARSRGHGADLDIGVPEEQSEEFATGIARGTGDRSSQGHREIIRIHA
jgi:hypothetical protein